jgi:hypothetical protein
MDRQLTHAPHGHALTNVNVWSADSQWIVYDVRSDPAGSVFDGTRIERVHADTGQVQVLYTSRHGAHCGVVTCHPSRDAVVFILGPERPTADWSYAAHHRHGVVVELAPAEGGPPKPSAALLRKRSNLDARDVVPPFTAGALRGGSHVHVFSPNGRRASFTYEDAVVGTGKRGVGVTDCDRHVVVPRTHPRNHDGGHSVVVTALTEQPVPGSDQIDRAVEEGWIDGRTLAVQGRVTAADGSRHWEVFAVDLPDNLTTATPGTVDMWPTPPVGTVQRRLTWTGGLATAPRHWLRASPDGSAVAFLMADADATVQLWTVPPSGGAIVQVTANPHPIASAFSWTPDGRSIAHVMDGSVCLTDVGRGTTRRLTDPAAGAPRPEACVVSPDGRRVAFVRTIAGWNQVFAVDLPG